MTNSVGMGKEFKKETWGNVSIKMLRKHMAKYVYIFLQNIRWGKSRVQKSVNKRRNK